MTRRPRLLVAAVAPVAVAGLALAAMAASAPPSQETPGWAKPCEAGTQKWAEPTSLTLGETTKVTLVITGTCPAISLPYDIVFVVDRSNSMTKDLGGPGPIRTVGPGDPTRDPADPTRPSIDPFPTQEKPKPTEPPIPTPPTALHSTASLVGHRVPGLAQGPIVPTETMVVPPTEPVGTPGKPTPPIKDPTGEPGRDPTRDLIRRDREEPAGDEDLIRAVREAILDFLDRVEGDVNSGRYRVALVSFNDRARIEVDLNRSTNGVSRVRSRLFRLRGGGNTRIDLGLSAGLRVLYGVTYRGRQDLDYKKVAILFSDGKADPRTTARLRLRKDITYIAVAAGRTADIRVMRGLASESEFFLDLRDRKELVERVRGLPAKSRAVNMTTLTVADQLQANMEMVAASANPAPSRRLPDGTLEWDFPNPTTPLTITYEVRPLAAGIHPVSQKAEVRWNDSEARSGKVPFPGVDVEVLGIPTATLVPTPTIEDTPSPVPQLKPAYLPISYNALACSPRKQTVDVALIVDASLSMGDPTQPGGITKLDAAIRAGRAFVSLLKPDDQGAVVGFNSTAHLLTELTSDKGTMTQALGRLPAIQARGTRIDEGLRIGADELLGPRHRSENNRALVLVTDGHQEGGANSVVLAAAEAAKSDGITVWTVGLGANADQDLLRLAASRPATYLYAPNAEDLELIYEDIARLIPCP